MCKSRAEAVSLLTHSNTYNPLKNKKQKTKNKKQIYTQHNNTIYTLIEVRTYL